MPPIGFTPAMVVPLALAVWLIDGSIDRGADESAGWASARAAFGAGWWWGFGYFVAGLWWLGSAFLVQPQFAWALPLGVLGLPAALAFFPASGFALARLLWSPNPFRVLALAVGLGASEWLRCVVSTGFPWNDLGMTLGQSVTLAQVASIVGLHGLTLLSVAIFAAPATLWTDTGFLRRCLPTILAGLALAAIFSFGALRLAAPASATVANVKLRLMQPNVAQDADFAPENGAAIVRRYLALSDRATSPSTSGVADVTHLIWPESAFPFILSRDGAMLKEISGFLRGGAVLVTGAARMEHDDQPHGRFHYYNAIEVIDRQGLQPELYDKHHLVPFGEYMPFSDLLERVGITQFVNIPGGFDPGKGSNVLRIPGLPPALAMICYEAIFPNEIGAAVGAERPRWLLNVTDDAWFGLTSGPYQHFAQARLRAIELGLPLVRDANTGVSAVTDGYGRVLARTSLGSEAVLDSPLPQPLAPTWQWRWGSASAGVLGLALLALCVATRKVR
ncbi:MAG: apolipoprotein N-acyltransferase [Hyphomicrobiales bacterium]|nr:apolipoprotein N-acyltransferase [Hyphomicrobiales bacterium]